MATHTLTYSRELSSLFTDYEGNSFESSENECEQFEPIEFDLRDDTEVFGNENVLYDAPLVGSETVISLQAPPMCDGSSILNSATRPVTLAARSAKPVRDISKLVDELVGSPKVPTLTRKVASKSSCKATFNRRSPSSTPLMKKVFSSMNSPIFPVSRTKKSQSPSKISDWKCPDAWIPNHACDDFCNDSLKGL